MPSRKIILFIVEGITEQTCLAYTLSKLLNDNQVEFAVLSGDITTSKGVTLSNAAAKLGDIVRGYASRTFRASDFLEVVHLVDMDGAYISDDYVSIKKADTPSDPSKPQRPYYSKDHIYSNNVEAIITRNHQKAEILDKLIDIKRIWKTIPYSVYYFSCNLDHIMHNNSNLAERDKYKYANSFDKTYGNNPQAFLKFLLHTDFAVKGKYDETWEFIKADNNSLNRYTNFHLFFSNPKHQRETDHMKS